MSSEGHQPNTDAVRAVSFDPAFRPAVEAGHLTAQQALQRGRRDTCASNLAAKHGLTLDLALAVADNRMSLGRAIRSQRSPDVESPEAAPASSALKLAGMVLGIPLLLFVGVFAWRIASTGHSAHADALPGPSVARNEAGVVTRVEAARPEDVLEAFCDALPAAKPCKPLGLLQATRGAARLRVGVYVDPADEKQMMAIPIRQGDASRWSAGDGDRPLEGLLAPHNAAASLIPLGTASAD